jgi:hypothetical protein
VLVVTALTTGTFPKVCAGASGSGVPQEHYRPRPMLPPVDEEGARLSGSEDDVGEEEEVGGAGEYEEEEELYEEMYGLGEEGELEGHGAGGEASVRDEEEGMETREGGDFIAGLKVPPIPGIGEFGTVPASSAAAGAARPGFVTDLFSSIRATAEERAAVTSAAGARVAPHVPSHPLDALSTLTLPRDVEGTVGRESNSPGTAGAAAAACEAQRFSDRAGQEAAERLRGHCELGGMSVVVMQPGTGHVVSPGSLLGPLTSFPPPASTIASALGRLPMSSSVEELHGGGGKRGRERERERQRELGGREGGREGIVVKEEGHGVGGGAGPMEVEGGGVAWSVLRPW